MCFCAQSWLPLAGNSVVVFPAGHLDILVHSGLGDYVNSAFIYLGHFELPTFPLIHC